MTKRTNSIVKGRFARSLPGRFKSRVGMTLVETTIVMVVATAALAAGAAIYSDYLDNLTNKTTAAQMTEVTSAFSRYLHDNHLTLRAQVIANGGRLNVSLADLQPDYLPDEFQNRTPYNHEYVLTIRRPSPTSDVLQGLVFTQYSDSNFAIEPKNAVEISRLIGATGGYTAETDTQDVISTYGNYDLDLANFGANPGPGVMVAAISVDEATNPGEKYLHRNVTGDPDHNRMNTNIDMSGNDLNNVNALRSQNITNSQTITTNRLNSAITDAGVLTASQATVSGHTQTGTARVVGRLQSNSVQVDGGPVAPGAGEVSAGTVHASNWFRSHGDTGWYSQTYGGGWHMSDPTWIRAYNSKNVYTPGEMQAGVMRSSNVIGGVVRSGTLYMDGGASLRSDGTMHIQANNGVLHLNPWGGRTYVGDQGLETAQLLVTHNVGIGGGCTAGQVARSGASTVACVDGRWQKMGGGRLDAMDSCSFQSSPYQPPVQVGSGTIHTRLDSCKSRILCAGGVLVNLDGRSAADCDGNGN